MGLGDYSVTRSRRFLAAFLATMFTSCWMVPSSMAVPEAPPLSKSTIAPADVYSDLENFNRDLELVRRHMGAPIANPLGLKINKAAPHDVYFQALILFEKANRLSFEILRQKDQLPPIPRGAILPEHVLKLVQGAHGAVHKVMDELKIEQSAMSPVRDETKTPSDVFQEILATTRQMNLLLERRFTPSEVFQEVTLAIGYAARQLAQYPGMARIPDKPPLEKGKKPSDVYFLLLKSLASISHIYAAASLDMLQVDFSGIDENNITPSDVLDIASLVVARLDFLHKNFGLSQMPREAFYPGRKYPSDVYQQAGTLQAQLERLEGLIDTRGLASEPAKGKAE